MTAASAALDFPRLVFSKGDLKLIDGLKLNPESATWGLHLDEDEDADLLSIVLPDSRTRDADYSIAPAAGGRYAMSSVADGTAGRFFPSLQAALSTITPP